MITFLRLWDEFPIIQPERTTLSIANVPTCFLRNIFVDSFDSVEYYLCNIRK